MRPAYSGALVTGIAVSQNRRPPPFPRETREPVAARRVPLADAIDWGWIDGELAGRFSLEGRPANRDALHGGASATVVLTGLVTASPSDTKLGIETSPDVGCN